MDLELAFHLIVELTTIVPRLGAPPQVRDRILEHASDAAEALVLALHAGAPEEACVRTVSRSCRGIARELLRGSLDCDEERYRAARSLTHQAARALGPPPPGRAEVVPFAAAP
jgi:hypothetical protein